jgi:serine/threonine-protein kinase
MREFLEEIKRRNVFKVALVYIVAAWLTMQVVDVMFPALNVPGWLTSVIAVLLLIGFQCGLIFAWAFERTREGIKREKDVDRSQSITAQTGKKLNNTIIVILVVAVGFLLFDKFAPRSPDTEQPVETELAEVKPSIAVLPFVNMSDDKDNEYFSDGLSEELLNVLARIPALHVAGRTSSFQFKGENQDLREIGEKLNVANVLEGSVRQSGARLRITAQLIDTETGYHLWSNTYDRELTDVFAIQDEIAKNVVDALRITLLGEETPAVDHGTNNLDAYNLYLQASYFYDRPTAENFARAEEALKQAIELDPGYAQAYALLSFVHQQTISGVVGLGTDDFVREFLMVDEYADAALRLGPKVPEAYAAKANALQQADWNHDAASGYYERALQLAPQFIRAMRGLGLIRQGQTRYDESLRLAQRAVAIDPLSIAVQRALGDILTLSGRYDEALDHYHASLRLQPDIARINGRLARVHIVRGDYDKAAEYAANEPVEWVREMYEILVASRGENTAEFRAAAKAYEDKYGAPNSYQLAELYGSVGDVDSAIKWLEKSHEVHDPGMVWLQTSAFLVLVRNDPRWPRMVELAGY